MSHTSSTGAPSRHDLTNILKRTTGALTGRRRGPDQGEGRRVPRRDSYDVDDPRAKPWARVGDGTVGEGLAHREALLEAARDLHRKAWKDTPLAKIREAQLRLAALSAELAVGGLPVGRPAAIRMEIAQLKPEIEAANNRLRPIDVRILEALLTRLDYKTGQLFPSIEWIAKKACCHRNSVVAALRRLRHHGFIEWVRRSIRTGNEGQFAPQREQTSNAYLVDHRRKMAPRTWQRFAQLLAAKLRRLGNAAARALAPAEPTIAAVQNVELRATLFRVEAKFANAST